MECLRLITNGMLAIDVKVHLWELNPGSGLCCPCSHPLVLADQWEATHIVTPSLPCLRACVCVRVCARAQQALLIPGAAHGVAHAAAVVRSI